jgi:hypothetical protein
MAMKCTAQERDGVWIDVKKDPLDKSKESMAGRKTVVSIGGQDVIVPAEHWPGDDSSVRLKPVFENGIMLRKQTFSQVRTKARSY